MQAKYGLALVAIVVLFTLGISMQTQDAYALPPPPFPPTTICHVPTSTTIVVVSAGSLAGHLAHGDYLGACIPPPPPPPVLVTLCHNPGVSQVTLVVGAPAVPAHLAHGDYLGTCIPLVDTDGDGNPDITDLCPLLPETFNGYLDLDGCPDSVPIIDTDEDGIPDDEDECPTEPETFNGFQDEDGCPDELPDTDGDGFPDETDSCPAEAETINGFEDEDGCPDAIKSGGICNNCQPPTLGLNKGGDISHRLVEGGFTCEGQTVDVDNYYTPFPLITNGVGDPLNCIFKIYEDSGADKITHFEFAVGKRAGDSMSEEQGKISWSKNIMTEEETVTYDHNLFRSVGVTTGEDLVNCKSDSEVALCLQITLTATPKEPLVEDIIVKTNVWDSRHNGKTNFFNDGIDFVGNTENPMPFYQVLDGKNGAFMIYTTDPTLEDLNHAIDQFGQTWTRDNNGFWSKDYVPVDRSCDSSSRGFDRLCPEFNMMKQGQILLAQQHFDSSKIQSTLPDAYAINYPERD